MRRFALTLTLTLLLLSACTGDPPPPTLTPTAAPQAEATDPGCFTAAGISDVTHPSGVTFAAGVPFEKTWRIENQGACDWPAGVTFTLTDGAGYGASSNLVVQQAVPAGASAELTASMTAPAEAGRYTVTRQLRSPQGTAFGPAAVFQFVVEAAQPTLSTEGCTPDMTFIEDVTIPDDTTLNAADTFTKTWRIRNSGTCDWGAGYELVFYEGRQMGAAEAVPIPATAVGEVLDLSVEMTAPTERGTHTGIWYMQAPDGKPFGIPPYVRVIVVDGDTPAQAQNPPADAPAAASQPYSGQPIETAAGCTLNAGFVADLTVTDYAVMQPGEAFTKTWRLQNTGTCDWTDETTIVFAGGTLLAADRAYEVPAVSAGQTVDLSIGMTAPDQPGAHTSIWRLQAPDGTLFGIEPYVTITVPGDVASTAPYPNVSNITFNARQIWLNGQAQGRQPNVFSKVGDSISFAWHFLSPIGEGQTVYGAHGNLAPVIDYYLGGQARITNSWANPSLAAFPGWKAADLHNPANAEAGCEGLSPLQCEYRWSNPAVAVIMIGTNDCTARVPLDTYAANLNRIVEETIAANIIPVLSTAPPNQLCDITPYNDVVFGAATSYDVPLIDVHSALAGAPNQGVGSDGVHPSIPPSNNTADFTTLDYGYTLRNLVTVQALDAIWRQVLSY